MRQGFIGKGNKGHVVARCSIEGNKFESDLKLDGWDETKPIWLRLARHGNAFYASWKQAGDWKEAKGWELFELSNKLSIGCYVLNNGTKPVVATFKETKLTKESAAPAETITGKAEGWTGTPTATGTQILGWGTVENPSNAAQITLENDTLTMDMSPKYCDYNLQGPLNAPRVVNEVTGDFAYEVTFPPMTVTSKQGWRSRNIYVGSGWRNFLRLGPCFDNNTSPRLDDGYAENSHWADLVPLPGNRDFSKPLTLKVVRKGSLLTISERSGDGPWIEHYPQNIAAWPKVLKVGVMTLNSGKEPFSPKFSGVKLTRGN